MAQALMRVLVSALLAFGLASCGGTVGRNQRSAPDGFPALGLYQVVGPAEVDDPLELPEKWWQTLRYIEISPVDRGGSTREVTLTLWSSDQVAAPEYAYERGRLDGHRDGSRFISADETLGRSWIVLDASGNAVGYHNEQFRSDVDHEVVQTVDVPLQRVERTAELDKKLAFWRCDESRCR